MSSEWRTTPASEFCLSVRDGTHDSPKEVASGGKNLVTSRHIKGGLLDLSTSYKISEEDYEEINKRSKVDRWDILFSMIGTVGEVLLVKDSPNFAIKNVGLFKSRSEVTGRWLYYYLQSPGAREEIYMSMRGSTQQYIPLGALRSFPICHPPSEGEMLGITTILGTLDDKIELNRKTNETLEAMAKALFKSWFVDFDPVRAKAEGRPTGLPADISDLFPDSFEDSELGEIPSGWEIALLGDHIDLIKGRSYKSDELNPSTTALVTLKSFQRNGGYRPDGLKGFTGEYKEQQVVKPGELVIALTDVTQAADVIGRPAIVKSDSHCSTLVASLDVGIVRPKATGCFSTPYLYFLMLTPRYVQHILGYTSGTTVLHLAKDGASNFPLPIGSLPLLNHFAQLADSILRQVDASARQSELLAKTRDALLPKLISGELRIPDAERMLEEVGV
jgi:type I restriction enzyme S subunit